jgi:hypothetical protein
MANENIVAGLFGLTPEMYGEQQRRSALREGIDFAKLTPGEAGAAMTYAGAKGLGGAIAGAFGIEDPQLQRITQQSQLLQGLDLRDPKSLEAAAIEANRTGNTQLAFKLLELSDNAQIRAQQAQVRAQQAQTQRQTSLAQLVAQRAYQPGTPERPQMLDEQERQQMADQGTPMPENIAAVAPSYDIRRVAPQLQALGAPGLAQLTAGLTAAKAMRPETVSIKEGETLYTVPTEEGQGYKAIATGGEKPKAFTGDMSNAALRLYQTNDPAKIFAQYGQAGLDAVEKKALETTIAKRPVTNVTNTVSNNMQRGFGDTFTETISSNIKAGRAAIAANSAVQSMQTLLDEGVRTGFGQDTMLQLGRAGQFFDPEFKIKGLAGQEAFQSFATGVILPQVKQLGVNPTDADLKFISTGSPGLSKTPEGNKLLLSALQLKLNREQDLAKFTNQFLASNQELVTKNPIQAYTKFNDAFDQYTQTSPLYGPASDSLRQRFNALGARSTGNPAARNALQRGGLTN